MKNSTGAILLSVVSVGCIATTLCFAEDAKEAVKDTVKSSMEASASATPLPPMPEPLAPVAASGSSPSPKATAPVAAPPSSVPAEATPAPSVTSPIAFNSQNKETAKTIYQLLKDIQESEFDPEKNLGCINKLQDAVSQTDFSAVQIINGYIKDSLALNTLRSRDIKIQRNNSGKVAHDEGSKTDGSAGAGGPLLNVTMGGGFEKTNAHHGEDANTTDVSISSSNDAVPLDRARQQQAVSYGLLLNEMKHLGFSRPIDVKKIYGRWKWRCNEDAATYEFDFRADGTVYVKLNADDPSKWRGHGFVNKGRGAWKVDYRSLTLELNDINLAGFWAQHPLIFFAGKEIVGIDDEKMLLATDEDNELKRISVDKK
ncbi:MAG: hypothetical protein WCD79_05580 [Chthoniobacteraceae bacterium]